jgi:pimeloyl-ACP methyl ester carboxylesterase
MDDMLDAISLYWFTNSAASSGRIYWENKSATFAGPKLTLPVAVTVFPRDIPRLPRSWIEDTYSNLIHYAQADKGGHFAALEQPEILVSEIRTGLRTLRSLRQRASSGAHAYHSGFTEEGISLGA